MLLDIPAVGCARSILTGRHGPAGNVPGDRSPLVDRGETVGAALRTRPGVSPIHISVGHRCDLEGALALIRLCTSRACVPETTRQAHLFANKLRRAR